MEAQEIINLSINARMDYWPPHLGVSRDAEKIELLATKLDEAATELTRLESVDEENGALREERDHFAAELERLRGAPEGTPQLNEVAAKCPQALPEYSSERLLRERAEQFYREVGRFGGLSDYAAGWIAAKAHYESKQ